MGWPRSVALAAAGALALSACSGADDGAARVTQTSPPAAESAVGSAAASDDPTSSAPSSAAADADTGIDGVTLALTSVVEGLDQPLQVLSAPGDPRLLIVERPGRIQAVDGGDLVMLLDISERTRTDGERGLLGVAFHPGFADNRRVFVHYSAAADGATVLAELTAGNDGTIDPGSERILLTVPQPASNHNGGTVAFGPDGMLFLALGDGGAADDRFDNGQDPTTLLGALLRIDVDAAPAGDVAYAIPADNPFADGAEGAPEVWAYGLRNPYRFAFDQDRVVIADVGQNELEEVDAAPAGDPGRNYGWPTFEADACFRDPCEPDGLTFPVVVYDHDQGECSIIGGAVYRGEAIPALAGEYFYADLCAGFLRSVTIDTTPAPGDRVPGGSSQARHDWTEQVGEIGQVLSVDRDGAGELYVSTADGRVLRIVAG